MKKKGVSPKYSLFYFSIISASAFYGCHHGQDVPSPKIPKTSPLSFEEKRKKVFAQKNLLELPVNFSTETFKEYLATNNLKKASQYINLALQKSPKNSALHILNGLLYEAIAQNGEDVSIELAGIAYRSAKTAEPSHWLSSYLLGLHELQMRRYESAQKNLCDAFCLKSDDGDVLYALAYASYHVGDLPVAVVSIQRCLRMNPQDPKVVRSAAIIHAAAHKQREAQHHLDTYVSLVGPTAPDVPHLRERIEDWKRVHNQAVIEPIMGEGHPAGEHHPQDEHHAAPHFDVPEHSQETVGVDFYSLRVAESEVTEKGNNILDTLAVTLGGAEPLVSLSREISGGGGSAVSSSWSKAFNYAISPASMLYNLNIANVTKKTLEVADRPSIFTLIGKPASFYSGTDYIGTSSGASGSGIMDISTGSKVEITPIESDGDYVTIEVMVTGSMFLEEPTTNVGINDQLLAVTKAKISNTIRARYGQTIVIGGLTQTTRVNRRSGVPLLGDIPFLQYFFATEQTKQDRRSVLFLLTPRRGTNENFLGKRRPKRGVSAVAKKLQGVGLLALGEYTTLYHIMRKLETHELFYNIRSGDMPKPFYGQPDAVQERLQRLSGFLYF